MKYLLILVMAVLGLGLMSCKTENVVYSPASAPIVTQNAYYTADGGLVIPGGFQMQNGHNPEKYMTEWKARIARIESGEEEAPPGYQIPIMGE